MKAAFVHTGLGPWQTGHNQAIVYLGKLWHPIAIIYGRKYLMFLEEVGFGEMREGEWLGFPFCPIHSGSLGG